MYGPMAILGASDIGVGSLFLQILTAAWLLSIVPLFAYSLWVVRNADADRRALMRWAYAYFFGMAVSALLFFVIAAG